MDKLTADEFRAWLQRIAAMLAVPVAFTSTRKDDAALAEFSKLINSEESWQNIKTMAGLS